SSVDVNALSGLVAGTPVGIGPLASPARIVLGDKNIVSAARSFSTAEIHLATEIAGHNRVALMVDANRFGIGEPPGRHGSQALEPSKISPVLDRHRDGE